MIPAVPRGRPAPVESIGSRPIMGRLSSQIGPRWAAVAAVAAGALALGGCQLKGSDPDLANGKELFVKRCGSCHTLNRAGTKGVVGPNLDLAFRQALADGFNRETVEGVISGQIDLPQGGQMPADLVSGKDREDVAAYVAEVASEPGKDQGLLATVGQAQSKGTAKAKGGRLELPIPDSGLIFASAKAIAEAGRLTILAKNPQSTPHNVALEGSGVDVKGKVVQGGATSEVSATVKPGKYVFYCSVPGHREGGMEGTLTVE